MCQSFNGGPSGARSDLQRLHPPYDRHLTDQCEDFPFAVGRANQSDPHHDEAAADSAPVFDAKIPVALEELADEILEPITQLLPQF
jgi:hypothetical protein